MLMFILLGAVTTCELDTQAVNESPAIVRVCVGTHTC